MATPRLLRRLRPRATHRGLPTGRDVRIRQLYPDTWLVEKGRRGRFKRLAGPAARTGLLLDERRMRRHMWDVERQLLGFLSDEHVALLLRELDINCVIDVGANTGQYARMLRHHGYTGRIVSFEPVAESVTELQANAAADPDWRVHPFALGEEDTTTEINATPGKKLSSLLPPTEFGKGFSRKLAAPDRQTVEVRRLEGLFDDVVAGIDRPRVYLKLDTQGFDLPAFRGTGERIREVLAMQSEAACVPIYEGMPRLAEQVAAYEAGGFEISGLFPVSRHAATLRVVEFDMMLVRPEARSTAPAVGPVSRGRPPRSGPA